MTRVIKSIDETFEDIDIENSVEANIKTMKVLNENIAKRTNQDVSELNKYYESEKHKNHITEFYTKLKQKRLECREAGKHLNLGNFGYIVTNHSRLTDTVDERCYHCMTSYTRDLNKKERQSIMDLPKMMQRRITI